MHISNWIGITSFHLLIYTAMYIPDYDFIWGHISEDFSDNVQICAILQVRFDYECPKSSTSRKRYVQIRIGARFFFEPLMIRIAIKKLKKY